VVGKTRSVEEFPLALKVGSHIKPNIELIKGLDPDLLVTSSNRFFSARMAEAIGARTFEYHPQTLTEIINQLKQLAALTGQQAAGQALIARLESQLDRLKPLKRKPKVIYEISALPLSVAGQANIVTDIIRTAGADPIDFGSAAIIKLNPEAIIHHQPQLYIYQVGPMSQNPTPPKERRNFSLLDSHYLKVDQLQWSRANSLSFQRVVELNQYLFDLQRNLP
jgi:iron complex transport system substrate-binding protein